MPTLRTETTAKFAGLPIGPPNEVATTRGRPSSPAGLLRHFRAGQTIYAEGDAAGALYKVVRGVVRTCRYLSDGRRQVSAFHPAGEVFGFEPGDVHRFTTEAVTECTIAVDCRAGAAVHGADTAGSVVAHALHRAERAEHHALLLGRRGAAEKLAGFLLEQERQSVCSGEIDLAMTRQDIADYLCLTIETVSRTFSQLERDNVIAFRSTRRIVLTGREALHELAA